MASSSRRNALSVALLVATGLAIWWGLRHPAAAAASASLDPVLAQRRAAAMALARMPDAPRAAGESLAAPAPADAASSSWARCGGDQAAVLSQGGMKDDEHVAPVEIRPAGQGWVDATHRIDVRMRSSEDPYVQAVATALNVGDVLTPLGRIDALARLAADSSDPRIYSLGYRSCVNAKDVPASCRLLSARRWAALDPGNAVPWVDVLNQAVADGDEAARREALANMAASTRFKEDMFGAASVVASFVPDSDRDLAAFAALAGQGETLGALRLSVSTNVMNACRDQAGGDADLAQQCDRIGGLMFDHSDVYIEHLIGATLHRMATGDASLRDRALAERDANDQKATAEMPRLEALMSDCGAASRAIAKRYRRIAEIGELEYQRERLRLGILY